MPIWSPGDTIALSTTYRHANGSLVDPTSPRAVITYPDGTTQASVVLAQVDTGQYEGTWAVSEAAPEGNYTYVYRGTIDGVDWSSGSQSLVQPVAAGSAGAQTIALERRDGTYDQYGAASYDAPVSLTARVEHRTRIVLNAKGEQVLSDTRAYLDAGTAISVGDRATYDGTAYEVLTVYSGQGLDAEMYVRADLGR